MTNQREAISKWLFENLRQDSNFYARDVVLTESVWKAAQAEQAETIAQLQLDNARLCEALTTISKANNDGVCIVENQYLTARCVATEALG